MVPSTDLNELDMSQYPTMKLIFDETGEPSQVQSSGQEISEAQSLITDPTSNTGQPSPATTPGTPNPFGTPTGTPGTPATSVGSPRTSSGRSGSGSTKEAAGFPFSNGSATVASRSGSGSTKEDGAASGTPGTPGTPTTPVETMSKEEEKKKLHFRLEIRPDDGSCDFYLIAWNCLTWSRPLRGRSIQVQIRYSRRLPSRSTEG